MCSFCMHLACVIFCLPPKAFYRFSMFIAHIRIHIDQSTTSWWPVTYGCAECLLARSFFYFAYEWPNDFISIVKCNAKIVRCTVWYTLLSLAWPIVYTRLSFIWSNALISELHRTMCNAQIASSAWKSAETISDFVAISQSSSVLIGACVCGFVHSNHTAPVDLI